MTGYGYGVDVGGTTVKLGLFTDGGSLVEKWEIPTDKRERGKYILHDAAAAILNNMKRHDFTPDSVLGVGIGVPGPVNDRGVVRKCVNLEWDTDVDVAGELGGYTGLPVWVQNDANIAALGELWQGGGEGYQNITLFTLGTGVGGGVIIGGKVISGCNGAGGEVGHIPVNREETRTCSCGKRGCLEQYASATGVARMAREMLAASGEPSLMREFDPLTAKDVWDCYARGDTLAARVVEQFGCYLGQGAAAVACVADPDVFVIGGGMSKAGQPLLEVTRAHYRQHAFHASAHTPFALAKLGNDAGIYGGMYLALQNSGKNN